MQPLHLEMNLLESSWWSFSSGDEDMYLVLILKFPNQAATETDDGSYLEVLLFKGSGNFSIEK